jgi:hypothetical protein
MRKVRNLTTVMLAYLVLLVCNLGTWICKFTIFLYFVGNLVFEIVYSTIIVRNFIIPVVLLENWFPGSQISSNNIQLHILNNAQLKCIGGQLHGNGVLHHIKNIS